MTISIRLVDSDAEIEKKINTAIADELNMRVRKNQKRVTEMIDYALRAWIRETPEVASLLTDGAVNSLNSQFGFPPGQAAPSVDAVIESVVSTVKVKIRPINKKLKGGLDFLIQPSSLRNLLSLPEGFIASSSGPLHWLSWLLLEGSSTIVYGYSYTPDFSGRSGGGTMSAGGVWRIPPTYSGVETDNFITRALFNHDRELSAILKELLE